MQQHVPCTSTSYIASGMHEFSGDVAVPLNFSFLDDCALASDRRTLHYYFSGYFIAAAAADADAFARTFNSWKSLFFSRS